MVYIKQRKGFTLIEMIISVAVLAVAGLAVAGLFIFAHVNNQKAIDLDQSVSQCSAIVEQIKATRDFDSLNEDSIFQEAAVASNTSERGSWSFFYDKDWKRLLGSNDAGVLRQRADYEIHVALHEMPDQTGLLVMDVQAVKLKPYALSQKLDQELYKLSLVLEAFEGEVAP